MDLNGVSILPKDNNGCVYYDNDSRECTDYKERTLYCRLWPIELFPQFGYATYDGRFYRGMDVIIGDCGGIMANLNKQRISEIKKDASRLFVSIPTLIKDIKTVALNYPDAYLNREHKPQFTN